MIIFLFLGTILPFSVAAPISSNSLTENLPRAAFKLPPEETWRTRASFLRPLSSFPVYSNRIPVYTFPLPSQRIVQVRDHASAPIGFQSTNKFLTNMPPSFPTQIFKVDNTIPVGSSKNEFTPFPQSVASKKIFVNMPPAFPSKFQSQPLQIRSQFSLPTATIMTSPLIQQFRSQDEQGGYHFNYSGGPSSRSETRDHHGVVKGSYSYVDAAGIKRRYRYVADKSGYRVNEEESKEPKQVFVDAGTTFLKELPPVVNQQN